MRPSFCETEAQPNPDLSRPHSLPWMVGTACFRVRRHWDTEACCWPGGAI